MRAVVIRSDVIVAALACALGHAAACGGDGKTDDGGKRRQSQAGKPPGASPNAPSPDPMGGKAVQPEPAKPAWTWALPKGLSVPPIVPEDNPMTTDKVALGHKLFMDKRLSVDGSRSCYSCHQNELGNADGLPLALGPGDKPLTRNTPTIWNVAYHLALYWDGRAPSLEKQSLGALEGGNMGLGDALDDKLAEVAALPEYKSAFVDAFDLGSADVPGAEHVAKALAAYQRTLLCGDTKHDTMQLDEAADRGWKLFIGKASCITCHAGDNFSDGLFHRTGIGVPKGGKASDDSDIGHGKVSSKPEDEFKFRTPTLRNVSKTAPYFHDGSVETLEEAVRTMAGGGIRDRGPVDEKLVDRQLTDAEIQDLVAFFNALDCPGQLEVIGDQHVEGISKTDDTPAKADAPPDPTDATADP
jgi:cytochrome c peroxidase